METTQIVGIVLVKNEEKYIYQVLSNVLHFCDKIIVADNLSTDDTDGIIRNIVDKTGKKIEYHSISHPRYSHKLIEPYAGSKTWIFAVDGDELYDPIGLSTMRKEIIEGLFDNWWLILGNVLNCIELDVEKKHVQGYLAPPCRSMTKLYNFNAITSWSGPCPERLHGGTVSFKHGYSRSLRNELYKNIDWDNSVFRCLHLCFLQRSSKDSLQNSELFVRNNISDMNAERFYQRFMGKILYMLGKKKMSQWKQEKYMRGSIVKKDITPFLSF